MKQLVRLFTRPSSDGKSFTYMLRYLDACGKRRWDSLGHSDSRRAEKERQKKEKLLIMGYVEPGSMLSSMNSLMTASKRLVTRLGKVQGMRQNLL